MLCSNTTLSLALIVYNLALADKVYEKFEVILLLAEADCFGKIENKSNPTWHAGAKDTIPHLV